MCINRNIVECKARINALGSGYHPVLIETLWNVKFHCGIPPPSALNSINRNIVECKGAIRGSNRPHDRVLIETLWNVKKEEAAPIEYTAGINRNIVECKEGQQHLLLRAGRTY